MLCTKRRTSSIWARQGSPTRFSNRFGSKGPQMASSVVASRMCHQSKRYRCCRTAAAGTICRTLRFARGSSTMTKVSAERHEAKLQGLWWPIVTLLETKKYIRIGETLDSCELNPLSNQAATPCKTRTTCSPSTSTRTTNLSAPASTLASSSLGLRGIALSL